MWRACVYVCVYVFVCYGLSVCVLPVWEPRDVVVYLSWDPLQDGVPEAFTVHQLPIMPIDHSQLHAVVWLVELPAIHLQQQIRS